jgi:hypothetical protein
MYRSYLRTRKFAKNLASKNTIEYTFLKRAMIRSLSYDPWRRKTTMNTDFLLIDGGCGGLETALHLRRLVPEATITIVNPQPYLIYRPWLIYLPA